MYLENINLKEMSWDILRFLDGKEAMQASEVAEAMNLKTRQVDAAVTKSLVRYGFVIREAKLTRVLKKEYNLLKITQKGHDYVQWKLKDSIV
jgi:predicted transcriptional regulator